MMTRSEIRGRQYWISYWKLQIGGCSSYNLMLNKMSFNALEEMLSENTWNPKEIFPIFWPRRKRNWTGIKYCQRKRSHSIFKHIENLQYMDRWWMSAWYSMGKYQGNKVQTLVSPASPIWHHYAVYSNYHVSEVYELVLVAIETAPYLLTYLPGVTCRGQNDQQTHKRWEHLQEIWVGSSLTLQQTKVGCGGHIILLNSSHLRNLRSVGGHLVLLLI